MATPSVPGNGIDTGAVGTNLNWKLVTHNTNCTCEIDSSYLEARKNNDGLDENEIDKMRKIIIKRHMERDAALAKKKKRYGKYR